MEVQVYSLAETRAFAKQLALGFRGGEVVELAGDVGTGKTSFTKGLAEGLGVEDDVQSPSFTISRVYAARDGLGLHHYDFYRLADPGILRYDLAESTGDAKAITVIEWAETVADVLPEGRIIIQFSYGTGETERRLSIEHPTKAIEEAYATWTQNR